MEKPIKKVAKKANNKAKKKQSKAATKNITRKSDGKEVTKVTLTCLVDMEPFEKQAVMDEIVEVQDTIKVLEAQKKDKA